MKKRSFPNKRLKKPRAPVKAEDIDNDFLDEERLIDKSQRDEDAVRPEDERQFSFEEEDERDKPDRTRF